MRQRRRWRRGAAGRGVAGPAYVESGHASSCRRRRHGPAAVDAALTAVRLGGNAVDAAIASMVVAMSTEPGVVSPMGGAYLTIWAAGTEPVTIDGNVEMPGRGLPQERFGEGLLEFHLNYGGGVTVFAGHGSVGLPGAFAALGLAHERYGAGAWAENLAPAIKVARDGFRLGSAAASYLALTTDSLFAWDPETRRALRRADGSPFEAGDHIVDHDLAASLHQIAERGAAEVYTGEIGRALASDARARGGLITEADLAAYAAVSRPSLRVAVGDWDLATNPPPSVGGPMLAVMLGELIRRGHTRWVDVIEVQRQVLYLPPRSMTSRLIWRRTATGCWRRCDARSGRPGDLRVDGTHLDGRQRRPRLLHRRPADTPLAQRFPAPG